MQSYQEGDRNIDFGVRVILILIELHRVKSLEGRK